MLALEDDVGMRLNGRETGAELGFKYFMQVMTRWRYSLTESKAIKSIFLLIYNLRDIWLITGIHALTALPPLLFRCRYYFASAIQSIITSLFFLSRARVIQHPLAIKLLTQRKQGGRDLLICALQADFTEIQAVHSIIPYRKHLESAHPLQKMIGTVSFIS